jgi:hypothetical protein
MKRLLHVVMLSALLHVLPAGAGTFSFGVISHAVHSTLDEAGLRDAIETSDAENLAFVVANGIKADTEPCSDALYQRRKTLLQGAKNGLVLSLAASDWADCRGQGGKPAAIGRLNRLRELFFDEEFSLGATKIPLVRQSTTPKFRSFTENARWDIDGVMFATVNLPADNNHYVSDAGRNSEFEDRQVANRTWLHRIFTFAASEKARGVVLFSDGNPLAPPHGRAIRDGYAEIRKQITSLAAKFPGRILIVHGQPDATPGIEWHGNLGGLGVGPTWIKLTVDRAAPTLFVLDAVAPPDAQAKRPLRASAGLGSATP